MPTTPSPAPNPHSYTCPQCHGTMTRLSYSVRVTGVTIVLRDEMVDVPHDEIITRRFDRQYNCPSCGCRLATDVSGARNLLHVTNAIPPRSSTRPPIIPAAAFEESRNADNPTLSPEDSATFVQECERAFAASSSTSH